MTMYDIKKYGKLIVKKSKGKLLIDLVTRFKTKVDTKNYQPTLENSYEVQLN
jgi:hypothetical protein